MWVLLLGAGLLLGDGMITPAISVLSAVEGWEGGDAGARPAINIPRRCSPFSACSSSSSRAGPARVGAVFGPIMHRLVRGDRGARPRPHRARAGHPALRSTASSALGFLTHGGWRGGLFSLVMLGAVVLVLTGGEAMYADMGHFVAGPIRISWFFVVFPCSFAELPRPGRLPARRRAGGRPGQSLLQHAVSGRA